jgi:hypothetical protein
LELNQDLADAQNDLIEAFGGTGTSIEEVKTQGQELLIRALIPIIESGKELFSTFGSVVSALDRLGNAIKGTTTEAGSLESVVKGLTTVTDLFLKPVRLAADGIASIANGIAFAVEKGREALTFLGLLQEQQGAANRGTDFEANLFGLGGKEEGDLLEQRIKRYAEQQRKVQDEQKKTEEETKKTTKATKEQGEEALVAAGSLADLRMKVSDLKKEIDQSDPGEAAGLLPKLLDAEQALKDLETFNKRYKQQLEDAKKGFGVVDTITRTQGFETSVTSTTTGGLPTARDIIPLGPPTINPRTFSIC